MEKKTFYRVCNTQTKQGLWYDSTGTFTGLIHGKFNFCKNCELPMERDSMLKGYLSAVLSIEDLYQWFTENDIRQLQDHNYFIHEYEATDYWFYKRFQHYVISQKSSVVVALHNVDGW